jgi:hypothetical protein
MQGAFAERDINTQKSFASLEGKMMTAFAERDASNQKSFAALESQLQKLSSWVRIGQLIERFWWIGVAAVILGVVGRALDWI